MAGHDVLDAPLTVRRAIGVVGQKHGCDLEATGRENLVLQGELYGHRRRPRAARDELLERFGLADAADRQVKTYSGGMQRRLDVALGLIHRPQVLFLDEPTTGLDPEARALMWAEIERLAREERMTILLTTHYLEEADRLASQLAIVDRGRIVARGTPDELKAELRGRRGAGRARRRRRRRPRGARWSASAGSATCSIEGRTLHARAANGAAAIPAVLAALEAHGRARGVGDARAARRWTTSTCATPGGPTPHDSHSARPGRSPCATCACCCASPRSWSSRSCSR